MNVFLLWHVRHAYGPGDACTTHRHADGELAWDEAAGDDVKLLGVYSSRERAEQRIHRARELPGFIDDPDCFLIDSYLMDEDYWTDGFVTVAGRRSE